MTPGPLRVAIVGLLGFAEAHRNALAACEARGEARWTAVVAPEPVPGVEGGLSRRGIRLYRTWQEMYAGEQGRSDLVLIPCGIHLHETLTVAALEAGYHVYCEKPAAGTMAEVGRMAAAEGASGRRLALGFQHQFSPGAARLKALLLSGRLGPLVRARGYTLWPRSASYYGRNGWAGRREFSGRTINDSPLMNAAAHSLQMLLFLAGDSPLASATPRTLQGENYRAGAIDSADTQFLRIRTEEGPVLELWATHACAENDGPQLAWDGERGRILWSADGSVAVTDPEGRLLESWTIRGDHALEGAFSATLRALSHGEPLAATVSNTWQQVACLETLFAAVPPVAVPAEALTEVSGPPAVRYPGAAPGDATQTLIVGIEDQIRRGWAQSLSFAELGLPWADLSPEVPVPGALGRRQTTSSPCRDEIRPGSDQESST